MRGHLDEIAKKKFILLEDSANSHDRMEYCLKLQRKLFEDGKLLQAVDSFIRVKSKDI